jgi:hypothetical protein
MRLLDPLLHEWLSGSVLLPFMLLLLWGGTKWRPLNWPSRTRARWMIFWFCYGLTIQILLGTYAFVSLFVREAGADAMTWPMRVVQTALHFGFAPVSVLVSISIGALIGAAIDSAFGAISWWAFKTSTKRKPLPIERYAIGLIFSACLFGIANQLNFHRSTACDDCELPYGVPFTFLRAGGFFAVREYLWLAVLADSALVVLLGTILGWAWNQVSEKPARMSRRELSEPS